MPASVTSRALDVLGAFDPDHRSLTLTELAKRAGLPLATAHRLVGELQRWGALDRLAGGEYVIGRRLWDLGLLAPVSSGLRQAASPFLHDLYGATLATVHLAVRDGIEVLYIDRLSGHVSVPVVSKIGSRLPMHATGVGKVLLAYAPPEVAEAVLSDLSRVTPYTVRNPARLRAQLERVRIDGYATTGDEMSLGASSVAVPVFAPSPAPSSLFSSPRPPHSPAAPDVVAALGIVVPDLRREKLRLVSALQVAARGITRTLASAEWK